MNAENLKPSFADLMAKKTRPRHERLSAIQAPSDEDREQLLSAVEVARVRPRTAPHTAFGWVCFRAEELVRKSTKGVFLRSDFSSLGTKSQVDRAIRKLCSRSILLRSSKGVYRKPPQGLSQER
jgi:hypothetical protein